MATSVEEWLATISAQMARQVQLLERQRENESQSRRREDTYIEKLGKRIEQGVTSQLANRLGQAQSLANRGFGGTVEQARMDYAMEQLGRQFAAVMKPVMDALTYGAAQIELRMRMMGGNEQNRVLGLMGGGLAGFAASRFLGAPGLAMALGGGMLGAAGMSSGYSTTDAALGGGVGAYAGLKVGARFGPAGAAIGAGIGYFAGDATLSGDYGMMRKKGYNKLMSGLAAGGFSLMDAVGYEQDTRDRMRRDYSDSMRASPDSRRAVTPYQPDMMEAGGAYFAMQKSVIRATTGAGFEEENMLKPIIDAIMMVVDAVLGKDGMVRLTAIPASAAAPSA